MLRKQVSFGMVEALESRRLLSAGDATAVFQVTSAMVFVAAKEVLPQPQPPGQFPSGNPPTAPGGSNDPGNSSQLTLGDTLGDILGETIGLNYHDVIVIG